MEISKDIKNSELKSFKNKLTHTLKNIMSNCDNILSFDDVKYLHKSTKELVTKINDVLEWYKDHDDKSAILDYLKDYSNLNKIFMGILEKIPHTYTYYLCLIDSVFKIEKRIDYDRK